MPRSGAYRDGQAADKDTDATENVSSEEDASLLQNGATTAASTAQARGLQPPDFIRKMSPEEREELETRLRNKIDLRLLPMVILMAKTHRCGAWNLS